MKKAIIASVGLFCMAHLSLGAVVFDLNYNSYDSYMKPGTAIAGTVTTPAEPVPSIDFNADGVFQIPGISFPKPAFSVESRFYLRTYAPEDPNISEVLNAADCDFDGMGGTEGVDFRVGGGYNYALRPSDTYNNVQDWIHPDELQKVERAGISRCIGEFGLGVGQHIWKEVYTDRCVETNAWTHMVATWDGKEMRIFLNGHDATDGWRTNGVDLPAYVKEISTLSFGAEHLDAWRHMDGKIEFVRIHDKALSLSEIRESYLKTLAGQPCVDFIIIESPKAGEIIGPQTKISFSLPQQSDCLGSAVTYTYTVQLSTDPEFTQNVYSFTLTTNQTTLGDLIKGMAFDLKGIVFIRVLAGKKADALGKRAEAAPAVVLAKSAGQPAYLIDATVGIIHKDHSSSLNRTPLSGGNVVLFDCMGRRVPVSQYKNGLLTNLKTGIYFTNTPVNGKNRLLLVR
jgi:hypothetical protein